VSLRRTVFIGLTLVSAVFSNCYSIGAAPVVPSNPAIGGTSGATMSDKHDEQIDKSNNTVVVPAGKSDGASGKHFPNQMGRVVKGVFGIRSSADKINGATGSRVVGVESPRDMNLFQLEPTIIDERYYTSGRSERHQRIPGTTDKIVTVADDDKAPTYTPYPPSGYDATKPVVQPMKVVPSTTTPSTNDYVNF
jgi:hypothetical protein